MAEAYGFANRCLTEITAEMLKDDDLCKFVYYTQELDNNTEILEKSKPLTLDILNKNIFIGRRVPDILHKSGAYICSRVVNYAPIVKSSEVMKVVEIEVMVLVHENCMKTPYGVRDVCIMTALERALDDKKINGVGKCIVTSVTDINGLPIEYSGYFVYVEVQGFPTLRIKR